MKYLLISLLFICSMASAQKDTIHIKNKDSIYINVAIGNDHIGVAPDSVFEFHMNVGNLASVVIRSERGSFSSTLPSLTVPGNYTLVVFWSDKKQAYRTIFRHYQEGD